MALLTGSRLGPYEILSPIGAGGMGEIYKARDHRLGRFVAIKVLPDHLTSDEEALRRFEREARAVATLSHPHIIAIHDIGKEAGQVYVVMELLEGETLRARLGKGSIPIGKALDMASTLAEGLAAAHAKGIVHRDLKPENIFVTEEGRVKILDFGLARSLPALVGGNDSTQAIGVAATTPGTLLGTVGYMSPEQVRGLEVDSRGDIFSFGCVLYEMATGQRAFSKSNSVETLSSILQDEPREPSASGKLLSPELSKLLAHCLEKNREERFQSARDLAFALKAMPMSISGGSLIGSPSPALPKRKTSLLLMGATAAGLAFLGLGYFLRGIKNLPRPPSVMALTHGTHRVFAPAISPDGKWVAYLEDAGSRVDLWVRFIEGGTPVNLTEKSGLTLQSDSIVGGIDIAPDGSAIAIYGGPTGTPWTTFSTWLIPAPLGGVPRKLVQRGAGVRWSPDGSRICFMRPDPNVGDSIMIARVDGQDEKVLMPGADGIHLHQPTWSADGRHVYYIKTNPDNSRPTEIWRVSAEGGKPEKVIPSKSLALNPVATPDGEDLVYAGDRAAELLNLWRHPLNSHWWEMAEDTRITTGSGEFVEPRFSRDGKRLICTARRGTRSLVRLSATTEGQKDTTVTLTGVRSGDIEPAVCARTGQVVFSSYRSGTSNIWTLPPGSMEAHQISTGSGVDRAPAISPDGSTVAFVSERDGARGIWLVPAEGGMLRLLVHAEVLDRISFSPDGKRIVYATGTGSLPGLWIASVDQESPKEILGVAGRAPAWSPSQDLIAYISVGGAQSGTVKFTDSAGHPKLTDLPLAPKVYNAMAWSHDGQHLTATSSIGILQPQVFILDLGAKPALRTVMSSSTYFQVLGLAWSADDKELLLGRQEFDGQILLLDWGK